MHGCRNPLDDEMRDELWRYSRQKPVSARRPSRKNSCRLAPFSRSVLMDDGLIDDAEGESISHQSIGEFATLWLCIVAASRRGTREDDAWEWHPTGGR